jgi:hypothetical protein
LAKKLYGDGIRVWERTPWHATQRAAWEALKKGGDELSLRRSRIGGVVPAAA